MNEILKKRFLQAEEATDKLAAGQCLNEHVKHLQSAYCVRVIVYGKTGT